MPLLQSRLLRQLAVDVFISSEHRLFSIQELDPFASLLAKTLGQFGFYEQLANGKSQFNFVAERGQ